MYTIYYLNVAGLMSRVFFNRKVGVEGYIG